MSLFGKERNNKSKSAFTYTNVLHNKYPAFIYLGFMTIYQHILKVNIHHTYSNNNNNNNNRIERRNSRFCTISSPRCALSPTHMLKWPGAQSCANHASHIELLSCATCHATCHVARWDSSAIKFEIERA